MSKRKENPNSKWTNKFEQQNGGYSKAYKEEKIDLKSNTPIIYHFEIETRMPGKKNPRVKQNRYYGTPPEYTI